MVASECELCGKEVSYVKKAKIEGTVMEVCNNCSSLGQQLSSPKFMPARKELSSALPKEDVVDDYHQLIRNSRQKANLTIEQLAVKIFEKASELRRVEEGKLKPSLEMARKLEKVLDIRLVSERDEQNTTSDEQDTISSNDDKLTLGDFIKIKKKQNS